MLSRAGEKDRPGWDANSSAPHHPIIGHTGSQIKLRNLVGNTIQEVLQQKHSLALEYLNLFETIIFAI